jgi:hypothetical protein
MERLVVKGISVHTQAVGGPKRGLSESQRQRVPTFGRLDAHIGRCMMYDAEPQLYILYSQKEWLTMLLWWFRR